MANPAITTALADGIADQLLRESGHPELALSPKGKRKGPLVDAQWSREQGIAYFDGTDRPRKDTAAPRRNGMGVINSFDNEDERAFDICCAQPPELVAGMDADEDSTENTTRAIAREALGWVLSALEFITAGRVNIKLSAKQVALLLLCGDPRFVGKSIRQCASICKITPAAVSEALADARATLFQNCDHLFTDLMLKPPATVAKLRVAQRGGRHWRNRRTIVLEANGSSACGSCRTATESPRQRFQRQRESRSCPK